MIAQRPKPPRARAQRRPNPFLSQARAYWRVAAKKKSEGDRRGADWYAYQAQMAYDRYWRAANR